MRSHLVVICLTMFFISSNSMAQNPPMDGNAKPFTSLREKVMIHQVGWDIGLNIGSSHSLADIGGTRDHSRILFFDTQWKASGLNLGLFGRYRFDELWALTTEFNFAQLAGADSLSPSSSSRYRRDYHFKNNVYELAFKGEVYVPKYYLNIPVDIYAFVGFGILYHDPQLGVSNPETFENASFSHVQPIVPMGVGLHYTLPNNFRIGYKLGWRKTFTDHLDALSTRSSRGNDSYYLNSFTIGYYFKNKPAF